MKYCKKIILFLLLGLFGHNAYSTVDFTSTYASRHVMVLQFSGPPSSMESNTKQVLFFEILKDFNKMLFNDTAYIYFYCGIGELKSWDIITKNQQYALGYGVQTFYEYENTPTHFGYRTKPQAHNTIELYCSTGDFDFKQCLQLIYHGLKNKKSVELHQRLVTNNTLLSANSYAPKLSLWSKEIIQSVNHKLITSILDKNDTSFLQVLNKKYYSRPNPATILRDKHLIEYYWQHNKFHVYKAGAKRESTWKKMSYSDTNGKVLLETNDIYHILNSGPNNYFVFTSDTTYYHILSNEEIVKGPFHFPRLSICDMHSMFHPYYTIIRQTKGTFIFPMYSYMGEYNLVMDSTTHKVTLDLKSINKRLIDNINQRLKDCIQPSPKYKIPHREIRRRETHIIGLLIAAIALNGFLIFYRKK